MPTAFCDVPIESTPRHKCWTRAEYDALAETGLFDGQHLELTEGELIDKTGKKRPHVTSVALLVEWSTGVFGSDYVLQESPIDVAPEDNPSNEPEPDLIVLAQPLMIFKSGNPCPQDLRLAVEVADSTAGFDLATKSVLYARASIVEYWVLDIPRRRMIVHRNPESGRYASVVAYNTDESVSPTACPGAVLPVSNVLPE
jgi:Uma2 family endonuclease